MCMSIKNAVAWEHANLHNVVEYTALCAGFKLVSTLHTDSTSQIRRLPQYFVIQTLFSVFDVNTFRTTKNSAS